jgi:hypothetical protein
MNIVYDTQSAESRNIHNRRSATCGTENVSQSLPARQYLRNCVHVSDLLLQKYCLSGNMKRFSSLYASRWHCGYENSAIAGCSGRVRYSYYLTTKINYQYANEQSKN